MHDEEYPASSPIPLSSAHLPTIPTIGRSRPTSSLHEQGTPSGPLLLLGFSLHKDRAATPRGMDCVQRGSGQFLSLVLLVWRWVLLVAWLM